MALLVDSSFRNNIECFQTSSLLGSLNDIEERFSPKELFVLGDVSLLRDERRVAIIGTREPSSKGAIAAQKIAEFLVSHSVIIVSGLAKGVDTIAHKTAISRGGRTVAVIGTHPDKYYPKENKELQDEIAKKHLIVSQFDSQSPIRPTNFPARNRTMALLSQISVIVEAGEKSGTMHQGWEALRLGRPLFIHEDLVNNKELSWPSKLIEYGAETLYMDDLDLLLDYLPEKLTSNKVLLR